MFYIQITLSLARYHLALSLESANSEDPSGGLYVAIGQAAFRGREMRPQIRNPTPQLRYLKIDTL